MTDTVLVPAPAATETARELVSGPLRTALDRLDPGTRHWAGYHLGLWDDSGAPTAGGGKGVRSTLAVLSAQAVGAAPGDAVPAAVACELVHNFSLLHDDVMDGDLQRRHRPTVWARHGVPAAILAGDALLALANEVLAESPSPTAGWAVRCLNATTRRLVAGQAADLAFEQRSDVTLDECLQMAGDKTGALLGCAASLGAVLADGPAATAVGLARFGEHLGLAFQLVDDLLGIWGSTERTGKPVCSDLRAGKKSLPVVAALTAGRPESELLAKLLADGRGVPEEQLTEAAGLVEAAGGRAWAEQAAAHHSRAALDLLDDLALPAQVRRDLDDLTDELSRRDF